jgi:tRNA(fMet)-specific endonuclease VapC
LKTLVVDTSVVSYLLKSHTLAEVYWERFLKGQFLGISFMSVAELYRWPLERGWSERRIAALRQHLGSYVVLPYDDMMSWRWAHLMARKGRPMSQSDAWIAATALCYESPLVTHNARHFDDIPGLEVLSIAAGLAEES